MVDILAPLAQTLMEQSSPKFQDWYTDVRACSPRWAFFDISRDVAMATSQNRKIGIFPGPIYFVAMPFGNKMG